MPLSFVLMALAFGYTIAAHAQIPLRAIPAGETPAVMEHLSQQQIEQGRVGIQRLITHGALLFDAKFNILDGQGRPAATGNGAPTKRAVSNNAGFSRISGMDANSCSGCHNQPLIGGSGEFVANVFVLAQVRDPILTSIDSEFSNERNTVGMHGSGPIEMLAREMTVALQRIKERAIEESRVGQLPTTRALVTKGVTFGSITALPDGTVDTSAVEGVDRDLIIKPFHQKGVVVSLREFSNNAFNHHHGMQSVERFGESRTGSNDFDEDGFTDELTVGDITAVSIYQAALGVPGVVIPASTARREARLRGISQFSALRCDSCHRPAMELESPIFTEANPFNPPGNLRPEQMSKAVSFDMSKIGIGPKLERTRNGGAIVRAFTDLKRHVICDAEINHFCNERRIQGGVPSNQFLTRKLWDVGNSAPYGHRGDLTTISEAILAHGGAARQSRDAFAQLPLAAQADVVEFLKSLQVLPQGAPNRVHERDLESHSLEVQRTLSNQNSSRAALGNSRR